MINLLVLRSSDIDRAVLFYEVLGIQFELHRHGKGPEHWSSENNGFVFEIYPYVEGKDTTGTRLGFRVDSVDDTFSKVSTFEGIEIVSSPRDSDWGRRAVVKDFDGHTVELLSE